MMNKCIQTSALMRCKDSPFLGIEEKVVKADALKGLFEI